MTSSTARWRSAFSKGRVITALLLLYAAFVVMATCVNGADGLSFALLGPPVGLICFVIAFALPLWASDFGDVVFITVTLVEWGSVAVLAVILECKRQRLRWACLAVGAILVLNFCLALVFHEWAD